MFTPVLENIYLYILAGELNLHINSTKYMLVYLCIAPSCALQGH